MKFYQGKYKVKNISKYKGDWKNVCYRSSWELKVFNFLDNHPKIKWWKSEECIIPYISPVDLKQHRYFVDIVYCTTDNEIFLIEIKPKSQTVAPKPRKNKSEKFLNESKTYAVNQAKWKAASEYCFENGWKFKVWTEETLKSIGISV